MDPDLATGTITLRNLDARVEARLRDRAERNRRSMADEAGLILAEALAAPEAGDVVDLAEAIRRRFAAVNGVDLASHPPVTPRPPPRFDP